MSHELTATGKNIVSKIAEQKYAFYKEATLKHEKRQSRYEKHQSSLQNNQLT